MKNLLRAAGLLLGSLLAGLAARAQAPNWQTAFLAGGNAYSQITSAATADNGDVYVTGTFSNATITLGSITLTNTVTSGSTLGFSRDVFVARWSAADQRFVWARPMGGATDADRAIGIAVSGSYVYVVASLAAGSLAGVNNLTGDYLIRLSTTGAVNWLRPLFFNASALAVRGTSLYVAGYFTGTAALTGASGIVLTSAGAADIVVVKIIDGPVGSNFGWALQAGGPAQDMPTSLAVSGNALYLGAYCAADAAFGTGQALHTRGGLARLTDAGGTASVSWVLPMADSYLASLAVGSRGVYASGRLTGTATWGNITLTGASGGSNYLARVADQGSAASLDWAQLVVASAAGSQEGHTVVAQGTDVYLAGQLGAAYRFGGTTLTPDSGPTLFVTHLSDAGSAPAYTWAVPATAFYSVYQPALALQGNALYLAGMVAGPVNFGEINLPASGGPVAYLASLNLAGVLAARPAGSLPGLGLYPNPARGTATVRVPAGAAPASLTLLDALGRVAGTYAAPAGQDYPLSLAGLAPGVYALQVRVGGGLATQKLVVE